MGLWASPHQKNCWSHPLQIKLSLGNHHGRNSRIILSKYLNQVGIQVLNVCKITYFPRISVGYCASFFRASLQNHKQIRYFEYDKFRRRSARVLHQNIPLQVINKRR